MYLQASVAVVLLAGALGGGSNAATRADGHRHSMNISEDGERPVADCGGLHIRFNDRAATVRAEERTIPQPQGALHIESEVNGGVQVQGWDGNQYSVTACKAVDTSKGDAEQIFSQINLTVDNGKVSVHGPSDRENWTVFLLVRAPRGAELDLRANNGPLSIYNLDAKLSAHAVNGPVSLQGFSGEGDISAVNGPINLRGNSGKLRVHTENGPVSVDLSGDSWKGSGLEADAKNGPVTLRVPKNYQSGVLVESDGNSPMSCQPSICSDAHKTWDEEKRRIEFGSTPAIIHLSTVNGPVSVKQMSDAR
jgi:hypothetical protein